MACTQCPSVTIYTVHRVCCADMYPVLTCTQCTSVPVSLFTPCTESVVVTCTQCTSVPVSLFTPCIVSVVVTCIQCTSVIIYTVHRVACTCSQCTSVTIYTVHRVCCGGMYPVYQCHYLHCAQSLLWWHVPSVPVSLFTPCSLLW